MEDPLPPIAFSPSGDILATGHRDGRILLWDLKSGQQRRVLDRTVSAPSMGEITALAFSPDGALVAAAKPGLGAVDLWQVSTGEFEHALEAGQGVVEVAFSPDGRLLASAIGQVQRKRVLLWDTETWNTRATLEDVGPAVAFTQDGSTLVTHAGASLAASAPSADPESAIVLWDLQSTQQEQTIPLDGFVVSVDYHAVQNLLAANLLPVMSEGADPAPRTALLDVTSGDTLLSLALPPDDSAPPPTGPDFLAFSPAGSLLAIGFQPNRIDLRQAATGEHLLTLHGPADWLRYPLFSPDGALLAASSSDGRILLWSMSELAPGDAAASTADPTLEASVCATVPRPALVLGSDISLDRLNLTIVEPFSGDSCNVATEAYTSGMLAISGDTLYYPRRDRNSGTITIVQQPFDGAPAPLPFTTTPALSAPWFGLAVAPDEQHMVWATFSDEVEGAGDARYRSTVWLGDMDTETATLLWQEDEPDTLPPTIEPLFISAEENVVYFARRPYGIGGIGPFPAQYSSLSALPLHGGEPQVVFACETPFEFCLNDVDFERRLLATVANQGEQAALRLVSFDGAEVARYTAPDANYVGDPVFGPNGDVAFIAATLEQPEEGAPLFRPGAIRLWEAPYDGEPRTLAQGTDVLFDLWFWLDDNHLLSGDWDNGRGLALLGLSGERIAIPRSGTSMPLMVLQK